MNFSPRLALSIVSLAVLTALPAAAQTLTFDDLTSEQGLASDANPFPVANSGSRVYDGVTFNTATNSDWEVIGNQFSAAPSLLGYYGQSHSGDYYLSGNAYVGTDNVGHVYSGLTISTTQVLTSLWIGADNNGTIIGSGPSSDADTLSLSALGAGGAVLATVTAPQNLINPTQGTAPTPIMNFLDTSSAFGSLTGITGYSFSTNSLSLYASQGAGWVNADDLTFSASNPVPEASTTVSFGLLLSLGLGGMVAAARKRRSA